MSEDTPERMSQDKVKDIINKVSRGEEEKDKYTQLGDVFDSAKYESKNIYATVNLPGGGVEDENGVHNTVLIREMSGRGDMILMDFDDFDADSLKQIVLDCVESVGPYTDKTKIASLLFNDLLIGDYLHLVIRIRQLSVGDIHNFKGKCRKCNHIGEYSINLSELEYECDPSVKDGGRERVKELSKGPFTWKIHWHFMAEEDSSYLDKVNDSLSDSGKNKASSKRNAPKGVAARRKNAAIDLLTAQMIGRVDKVVEPVQLSDDEEDSPEPNVVQLGRSVKPTADGKKTMRQSVEYLRGLPMWVRVRFSSMVNDIEPGIDPEVLWDCEECGYENKQVVYPLSPNFFLQLDTQED